MARAIKVGEDKVTSDGFRLLGVGEHIVRIVKAELKTVETRKGDKELVEVVMKALSGDFAGCKMTEKFWLTGNPKTYERFGDFVGALGVEEGTTVDPNEPAPFMVGRTVRVKVKHEDREYQGETYTDAVLSGYVAWKALDDAEKAEFPDEAPDDVVDGVDDDEDLDDLFVD